MTNAPGKRRIFIAGHRGMVGSALVRRLAREDVELLTVGRDALDLRDQSAVRAWIAANAPDAIILAAAKVGGILANQNEPADFLADNLLIAANVIEGAHRAGVERLVFIASAAAYPLLVPQPMREEALLTGPLDPTHEGYAVAKIAGIKLCETYRRQYGRRYFAALPCNLYGVNDHFDPQTSHVVPALIRKFHAAKRAGEAEVVVWGSGTPRREFLYVDDLADAILFLLERYDGEGPINVGAGADVTIRELAGIIGKAAGFIGALAFDSSKPDGAPRRLMDSSRLAALGWRPKTKLEEGVAEVYRWFQRESVGEPAAS
jgi:GDP-L-fucose synthase